MVSRETRAQQTVPAGCLETSGLLVGFLTHNKTMKCFLITVSNYTVVNPRKRSVSSR